MVIVFFWQFQPSLKLKFHGEFDGIKMKTENGTPQSHLREDEKKSKPKEQKMWGKSESQRTQGSRERSHRNLGIKHEIKWHSMHSTPEKKIQRGDDGKGSGAIKWPIMTNFDVNALVMHEKRFKPFPLQNLSTSSLAPVKLPPAFKALKPQKKPISNYEIPSRCLTWKFGIPLKKVTTLFQMLEC